MKTLTFTLILFCCISLPTHSETLNIQMMADFIPQDGGNPENEATTFLLAAAAELGDEISLHFIPASRLREWQQLSKMNNVCLYNKLKTPDREAQAVFSQYPLMAFPANKLVVFNKPKIPDSITLLQAINDFNLTIGIIKGRSYSEEIDNFIRLDDEHFFMLEGATNAPRLGQMLFQNKIDAVLEYQTVFNNRYKRAPGLSHIRYISLKPEKAALFGYIACSPTEVGKQAVALFDKALKTEKVRTLITQRLMALFHEGENTQIVNAFNAAFEH
ncbi:ABC transporter substrate-binding protein [Pseudoalteromonas sp. SYSU M81236]|jgi:uncharacterized protein (TIGR02285 family)|uniref:ABC transporter substrate-binding protein n=1 Tax=unclassified Pseudoalteromonas TaxID=194690 RepID=UPI001F47ADEF|nr:ABC transporter substrate-binding protein [Pseudoalteromonas sp. OFAV1]MCF2902277.1 ABC transporter substrate-binding protein [Pseudoalteromonas sp. OFAV1]